MRRRKNSLEEVVTISVERLDRDTFEQGLYELFQRAAELAEKYKMQVPITTQAFDGNGKCFLTIEADCDTEGWKAPRVLKDSIPESGLEMPMILVLEDAQGKSLKARLQLSSQMLH